MASLRCAPKKYEMNPVLLAIVALLVIMAVSIAMAILFPYQDLNAQGSLRGAGKTEGVQVGIISEGIGGSGDIHSAVVQSDGDEKEVSGIFLLQYVCSHDHEEFSLYFSASQSVLSLLLIIGK